MGLLSQWLREFCVWCPLLSREGDKPDELEAVAALKEHLTEQLEGST